MATKTISLELDAYEKRRSAKKGGESFSDIVRRATISDSPVTGAILRAYYRAGGSRLRAFDRADRRPPGRSQSTKNPSHHAINPKGWPTGTLASWRRTKCATPPAEPEKKWTQVLENKAQTLV